MNSVTVFAPATVANVAVGFDILGFAVDGVGDLVTVTRTDEKEVRFDSISGISGVDQISKIPSQNTAGLPLLLMMKDFKPDFGMSVNIKKGIPLGSGMGGSAASAVGAVVAAHQLLLLNKVLSAPLPLPRLIQYALEGEAVASGSKHADNVAPCLYGGLTLSMPGENPEVVAVSYPKSLFCVLVHPDLRIDTKTARGILKIDVSLKGHILQSARLACFILGCTTQDFNLIGRGLEDVLIEPQRMNLIPGFAEVKKAALDAGAMGCSISGAGPAVFALTQSEESAHQAKDSMIRAFGRVNLPAQGWVSQIRKRGAEVQ